jgi:predicted ATPase
MRVDRIRIRNFKCFDDRRFEFHPEFNLAVGVNGSGKTALLNAISVLMGAFVYGIFPDKERRRMVRDEEVRRPPVEINGRWSYDRRFPVVIEGVGQVLGDSVTWSRECGGIDRYTTVHAEGGFNFKSALISRALSSQRLLTRKRVSGTPCQCWLFTVVIVSGHDPIT